MCLNLAGQTPTSFLHHNQISDVIAKVIMTLKYDYDGESPWDFGPLKLDTWTSR